jgi:ubiquinone/menaquinone biosynthesis C-methylase UbiE
MILENQYLVTQAAYDTLAKEYADNAFAKQWMKGYLEDFCAWVGQPVKLLDLGCGPGHDAALFHQQGFEVVGVDFSAGMIAEARTRTPQGTFIQSDLREMAFEGETFEAIWSVGSLHHLAKADVPPLLQKVYHCLKWGGYVFISIQRGEGEGLITQEQIGVGKNSAKFWSYWQGEEFRQEMEKVGFTIIKQTETETLRQQDLPEARKSEQWVNVWGRKWGQG